MPRLKKLEVQGFKSFADTLIFQYPTGVTAIVGPNGSGKSNIADAIRWVLGEQRMTTIRGHTSEDMIFAGSRKRSRSGMARASITFDNTDGWLPVDFAEVTVERRTYRDGKTEYRINGSRVRLKDLRDILDKGGLGRDAYLIIGQGLVDQVLSLKAQDRLTLFEQAAGISPYRNRREEALSRLTDTHRNLERVYDIIGEIEPRLRRLKRQKARADQHEELTRDLNETLKIWYGYRWGKALIQLEQAKLRVAYREDRVEQQLEEADSISSDLLEYRQTVNTLRNQLADVHRDNSVWLTEASNRQRELAVAREQQRQIQERLADTEANLDPLLSAQEAEQDEYTHLTALLAEAEERLVEATTAFDQAQNTYAISETQRRRVLEEQSHLHTLALEKRHLLADRQSRFEQAASRSEQLVQQTQTITAELEVAQQRRREQQQDVEMTRRHLDETSHKLQSIENQIADIVASKADLIHQNDSIEASLREQQAALTQLTARLDALDRLAAEGTGLYAGVRAVLQAGQRGEVKGLSGTVANNIQVPAELEIAIETALGSQAQNILADGWVDAQQAIEWLKTKHAGRATFLPLDTLRVPRPVSVLAKSGIIGTASDLVTYEPRYKDAVLLLLGRTAVAQNLDAARRLYNELHGRFRIVTLDGEILQSGGAVTGGQQENSHTAGLLARERERREIPHTISAIENKISGFQQQLRERRQQMEKYDQEIYELRGIDSELRAEIKSLDNRMENQVAGLERTIRENDWQKQRLIEIQNEIEQLNARKDKLTEEIRQIHSEVTDLDRKIYDIEGKLTAFSDDQLVGVVAERRTALALVKQDVENQRLLIKSREREAQRLGHQIKRHKEQAANLREELDNLVIKLDSLQAAYDEARSKTDALSAKVTPLERQLSDAEVTLSELERKETEFRRVLRDAEHQLNQAEMESSRLEDRVQNLRREIEETLDIVISNLPDIVSIQQPLPLEALVTPLPSIHELPEGLEQEMRDLRTQIRRLGPVNVTAAEEYDELFERHSFLRHQMLDLEKASGHLEKVIDELDAMMDVLFNTTFKNIATEFSEIFKVLFGGGNAALQLIEGDGTIEGVEISARPPGKRTSGLGMLSGGERTLTAVALLFAVMQVSPAPFCVLDEVDAMLDEANVGRFRRMLRDLANRTQFIIITHNRGTVEVADSIYGVSMQDDGVSQVLSLSIADLPVN